MIKEAYCSFKVAKLLKEKGFDERSAASYNFKGESQEGYGYWNKTPIWYAAPTHQMAMAWLREVHNLWCEISPEGNGLWYMEVYSLIDEEYIPNSNAHKIKSYEEAVEAALKYVLENLI